MDFKPCILQSMRNDKIIIMTREELKQISQRKRKLMTMHEEDDIDR